MIRPQVGEEPVKARRWVDEQIDSRWASLAGVHNQRGSGRDETDCHAHTADTQRQTGDTGDAERGETGGNTGEKHQRDLI